MFLYVMMGRKPPSLARRRVLVLLVPFLILSQSLRAAEPLPSPLTLEHALELADQAHPERSLAEADLAQARAFSQQIEADDDMHVALIAELRLIDPSDVAEDDSRNDSLARLSLSKQLYDFGRTGHAEEAAKAGLASRQWQLLEIRQQRRLDVMARFFDVLLADLEYARDNEALSIDYIRFDRARTKNELGKVSEIDMVELESIYQQALRKMRASRNRQRITRSQLAISLNRPLDLPADLVSPVFEPLGELPEIEQLVEKALRENPKRKGLQAELQAAVKQLQASEAEDNPVLRAELEAAAYQRKLGGRNLMTAALVIELPLYQGNRVDSEIAKQRALVQRKQAELARHELALRQQLLDHWMKLDRLKVDRDALGVTADFRDLYLDRSRTLYDLDMATDLGDSMSQIADIQMQRARNDFQIQLTHARIKALTGELLTAPDPNKE
ncbi:MAG: TolC family protein [Candidatus Thiodiazotropha sp. (ex Ctena orbiculata)]|uniref:TolC family protein n=1 Tax=Candidatus Thiodiazotropha taylori TaxID=2792791 RepID=A0A944M7L1_9GAMM|nr:TolC family protein [Candidatus Thiodiazotropha taylori]